MHGSLNVKSEAMFVPPNSHFCNIVAVFLTPFKIGFSKTSVLCTRFMNHRTVGFYCLCNFLEREKNYSNP